MGIFDFGSNCVAGEHDVKDECIISLKVYDACRKRVCLSRDVLGEARATGRHLCGVDNCGNYNEGDIIFAPNNATQTDIKDFRVESVTINDKTRSKFKKGYWDISITYTFVYVLVFSNPNGEICRVEATNSYTTKASLFGSNETESTMSTDLFADLSNGSSTLGAAPFVAVDTNAMDIDVEFIEEKCCCCNANGEVVDQARRVAVTIGLFSIIKLFRIVNLLVESKGFCIPASCPETKAAFDNACDFFDSLDFPMDVFAPPQKREFEKGISGNIPSEVDSETDDKCCCKPNKCNCGCCCNCR